MERKPGRFGQIEPLGSGPRRQTGAPGVDENAGKASATAGGLADYYGSRHGIDGGLGEGLHPGQHPGQHQINRNAAGCFVSW